VASNLPFGLAPLDIVTSGPQAPPPLKPAGNFPRGVHKTEKSVPELSIARVSRCQDIYKSLQNLIYLKGFVHFVLIEDVLQFAKLRNGRSIARISRSQDVFCLD